MPQSLDLSTPEIEGVLQASKSRKFPILIEREEMEALFDALGDFFLFDASRPQTIETAEISKKDFLQAYGEYISGIKRNELIDEGILRPLFSAVLTEDPALLYAMRLSNGKVLIKQRRPVIQLQRHHFIFSEVSKTYHSGVIGEDSITWGIQFSYPQMYLDPKTRAISKVEKNALFPNTALFECLAKWVRHYTRATPFIYQGEKKNVPMRLGKQCFSWIQEHPGLKKNHLEVHHVNQQKNS